jgi:transposase
MIDTRLVPDTQEMITPGEAVAGMSLNGLGFAKRPLSLTPQFVANTPLDLLCREGIYAEMFNRLKLGRTLDAAYTYGCDRLFQELALAVCAQEGIDRRFNHLDTTSFSRSGEDVPASDAHAMTMTHGYAKDHRPDLQQAVVDLMVSQDGGVPFVRKSWDGTTSDIQIFQERAPALRHAFTTTPSPRYLVAEAQRYHEDNASSLHRIGFLTRIPNTLGVVSQVLMQALGWETWQPVDDNTRYQPLEFCHDGLAQRWLVVDSQAALERAAATLTNAKQRAHQAITTQRLHLQAQRFGAPCAAQDALAALATPWTDHRVESSHLREHKHDAGKGRPTPRPPLQALEWQLQAHVRSDDATLEHAKQVKACFVLGTNIDASELSHAEVIAADKGQAQVEGSFRFLNDPLCFVASLFVKKPNRTEGLLMVMTLALLVYSVAQRRLRKPLAKPHETVPNQIHQPTTSPT